MNNSAKVWFNSKYIFNKHYIWVSLFLSPLLLFIPCLAAYVMYDMEIAENIGLFVVSLLLCGVYTWGCCSHFSALYNARDLVFRIEIESGEAPIVIECYYGRCFTINKADIESLDTLPDSLYYRRMTFMAMTEDNYILTTKQGQKFYLSGLIEDVNSLVDELNELVDLVGQCES